MIPLKLEKLLEGRVVESDRIEYKRGWNPTDINSVPFDDRVNRQANIDDIRRGHIEDFLVESKSSLAAEINKKSMEDMLIALEAANATDVGIDIRNIGLLMFGDRPEKFLPGAQIELIRFHSSDAEGSDDFTEKTFVGPIQKQVRDALSYIKAVVLVLQRQILSSSKFFIK